MTIDTLSRLALLLAVLQVAACSRSTDAQKPDGAAEPPTLNVTHWTGKTELYMEYPPLVAGQSVRFAVHLTTLHDFHALAAGVPAVEFTSERGGTPTLLRGAPPSRPGAFRVEGVPPAAGQYRWALLVEAPGVSDRHDLGMVTVYADERSAEAEAAKRPADDPAAIAYLKEQQWTNAFATAVVGAADLRASIQVPASIEPLSGGEAVVTLRCCER